MEGIRLTESPDKESVTLTIINDKSHGYRSFTICKEDMEQLVELYSLLNK